MKRIKLYLLSLLVIAIVVAGGWFIVTSIMNSKAVSFISLDINSNSLIEVNKKGKVTDIKGVGSTGKSINAKTYKNKKVEDVIKELCILSIENKISGTQDNYVLVSTRGEELNIDIPNIIENTFKEKNIRYILIESKPSEFTQTNAEKYNISESRAAYIEEILKKKPKLTFEDLYNKSLTYIESLNK